MLSLNRCFIVLIFNAVAFVVVVYLVLSSRETADVILVWEPEPCGRSSQAHANSSKIILFWTSYFESADFAWGYGHEAFTSRGCPVDECETTSDRNRLSQADAVIFHIRDLDPYDMPTVRNTCQRWIFFLMETPLYTSLDLAPYNDFFNWTFTYRFDSDIPPRILLLPKSQHRTELKLADVKTSRPINHAEGKTRLAVWLVSNCHTFSHRERYVNELRKHVSVDVYGECGITNDGACNRSASLQSCYQNFEARYKFYLSFENTLCRDYFSEKLYNIYDHDMVPVVLGKVDYKRFAPPHSLVDASDFSSPADLAAYLQRVNTDDDAYNAFFDWKLNWTFSINTAPWCDLCVKLNDANEPKKFYADMKAWWVGGGNCTNDVIGSWKIASRWDPLVDAVSVKWNSLKHRTNLFVKNFKSNKT